MHYCLDGRVHCNEMSANIIALSEALLYFIAASLFPDFSNASKMTLKYAPHSTYSVEMLSVISSRIASLVGSARATQRIYAQSNDNYKFTLDGHHMSNVKLRGAALLRRPARTTG